MRPSQSSNLVRERVLLCAPKPTRSVSWTFPFPQSTFGCHWNWQA